MHPLDNVIWKALTTVDARFAESRGSARRFPHEVTALGAFSGSAEQGFASLAELLPANGVVALFLAEPAEAPAGFEVVRALPLLQMLHDDRRLDLPPQNAIALAEADVPEMMALAELTRPGPFGKRTRELGTYLGIRRQARLVAMAGERLRLPGYTEVSAVCTHPEHTGNGYAAALIAALVGNIQGRGESAMLHSAEDNQRAIALYERLGFKKRTRLHLLVVRKTGEASKAGNPLQR
ncbi:MAG TPA: GNAT family N-acetyltransferase [Terriglobales bacterium]|nr:GNAT family N-acetyltransferase [Terriglobales bacterium]